MKLTRLKEWREARGLTQVELANSANISDVTVFKAEHGSDIRPNTARKLADAMGVSVRDLMARPPVPLESPVPLAEAPDPQELLGLDRREFLGRIRGLDRGGLETLSVVLDEEAIRARTAWGEHEEISLASRLDDLTAKGLMVRLQMRLMDNPNARFASEIESLAGA